MNASVVAFGGGHGLAAALRALRLVTPNLTAVVGVSDNGGSSGRLRRDFGLIPPGDLRMALTALCDDREWGQSWARTLQHRFQGDGELAGHALGNLLIAALWQQRNDVVAGLDAVSALLGCQGRVLPLALQPLEIVASVETATGEQQVRGQVEVATAAGRTLDVWLEPRDAQPTPAALQAVAAADVLVFGPGSWFTSVLTHFALPQMRAAIANARARRVLIANLCSQTGETEGFSPAEHLQVLRRFIPEIEFSACLVDTALVDTSFEAAAAELGARVISADLSTDGTTHDHLRLAACLGGYLAATDGEE